MTTSKPIISAVNKTPKKLPVYQNFASSSLSNSVYSNVAFTSEHSRVTNTYSDTSNLTLLSLSIPSAEYIADEVVSICLKSNTCNNSLVSQVRQNILVKHYKPQLISHIQFLINRSPALKFKDLDTIVYSCLQLLGL